jgi:hypothetical protein
VGDSDDTPRDRPRHRRAQTATERDLDGLRARGERADRQAAAEDGASTDSERTRKHNERKASRTHPRGVPISPDQDMVERELSGTIDVPTDYEREITQPVDMLRRRLDAEEFEVADRMRRDSDDPITMLIKGQFNLAKEVRALRVKDRSGNLEQADKMLEIRELIKHPPHEAVLALQEETERLWRAFAEMGKQIGSPRTDNKGTAWENIGRGQTVYRVGVWLAGFALTAALGSASYVIGSIRASGADEVLRAQDRHDIEELKQELKEARRALERLKDKTP